MGIIGGADRSHMKGSVTRRTDKVGLCAHPSRNQSVNGKLHTDTHRAPTLLHSGNHPTNAKMLIYPFKSSKKKALSAHH